MMRIVKNILLCGCLMVLVNNISAQKFVHPGLLLSQEGIARMKQQIALKENPTYADFILFEKNAESQATYKMKGPLKMVGRNPSVGQSVYDADANAAFQNAVMWILTNKKVYAKKAIEIVNAWSKTLQSITGKDAVLMAGLGPFKMVNAAELLRYSHAGWKQQDIAITEQHFEKVIYPVIENFAPFANGNWDGAAEKTMMAIGVFCNNQAIFDRALNYYIDGSGDGCIYNYIYPDGECQESGRDQQHTQLGLAHLADCCEMAWTQGLDLYAFANNRLLKGFEYTAKYNLGNSVNYTPKLDRTGKYFHPQISEKGRGQLRAIYAEVYNHYHIMKGIPTPYLALASKKIAPEGQGLPGADHIGFGNLLYTQFADNIKVMNEPIKLTIPRGIIAKGDNNEVKLFWVKIRNAKSYTIERSSDKKSDYKIIGKNIRSESFVDKDVEKGVVYHYRINAVNKDIHGNFSSAVTATSGLPDGWTNLSLNQKNLSCKSYYSNSELTINAKGSGLDSNGFHGVFINKNLTRNAVITIEYIPQLSSQFSSFGLRFKDSKDKNISLILQPISTKDIELPNWQISLFKDNSDKPYSSVLLNGDSSIVTYGRMTGSIWLRLKRIGNNFMGFYSKDGIDWSQIGFIKNKISKNVDAGILCSSGKNEIGTTINFKNISISDK